MAEVDTRFDSPFDPPLAETTDVYSTNQQKLKYPIHRFVVTKKYKTIRRMKGGI